jgi:hypothetical protein
VAPGAMLGILFVTLPMVLPATALQMCIGVFTKSARR